MFRLQKLIAFVFGLACLVIGQVPLTGQVPVRPLSAAHAHNDYEHQRPLLEALDHGFTSIEADVFLVDGQLLVAHNLRDVRPTRTLEGLYLEPLSQRVKEYGAVYPAGDTVTLLIDIKSEGATTYAALDKLLAGYAYMLSVSEGGLYTNRAVTVVISGNRPTELIRASQPRYAGVDGRLSDLDSDLPADLLPLISDNWRLHFRYRGQGDMSQTERDKLRDIVDRAHRSQRRVRFWATPESETLWQVLCAAGVDLIGTDDLPKLSEFLRSATGEVP
ncbi:MAG: phosphatidylinositol-specific phospholipase C/glycerophosphodiester phosphodiesterase family protein [Pirellulaceae bacterium]|nr:phosphatidylinositol-specific phospholipase C/glycerophosphodiester phosphodiesterase family protein [Pirellulaceae bacterium]